MYAKHLLRRRITVSCEIRVRFHEQMTHVSIVVGPSVPVEMRKSWKEFGVHERGTGEEIMFRIVRHLSPFRQFERLDCCVQHVPIHRHLLLDQQFDDLIDRRAI